MLVFFFLEKKKGKKLRLQVCSWRRITEERHSLLQTALETPQSHILQLKQRLLPWPAGAVKTFCFVLPVWKICLKINYKRKEKGYLCSHFHHDGTPLVRTSNTHSFLHCKTELTFGKLGQICSNPNIPKTDVMAETKMTLGNHSHCLLE